MRVGSIFVTTVLLLFVAAPAAAQVRVTPDSHLEDVDAVEGFAHLDTGTFATWVDAAPGPDGTGRPDSLVVGGVDLMPHLSGAAFREVDRPDAYAGVALDVIANLGVDALADLVVTIDAPQGRVYFERPGENAGR